MKKTDTKRATDDGPVYMEFKSYKSKKPIPQSNHADAVKPLDKSLPSSSGENTSQPARYPRYKELQTELKLLKDKQCQLTRTMKSLQTENDSLKIHIETLITPQTHHQLQREFDHSEQQRENLQQQIDELLATNRCHKSTIDQLNEQVRRSQSEQHDVRVQLQMYQQLDEQRTQARQHLTKETESLQETIQTLTNENEIVKREREQLYRQVDQLKAQVAEMDRKVNVVSVIEKKLKNYETQVQRTAHQNKALFDQNESCTRFVQVLENDMQTIKNQNLAFAENGKQLRKELSTVKKNFQRLRHKYDEVNKENKILKEKETRYLLHERFNVGKYASKLPTLGDIRNAAADAPNNSTTREFQMNNYMRAAKNVKTKHTEQFDELYYLLHRTESVKENKSDNNETNKMKK